MGIEVKITNVDKDANTVTFEKDGNTQTTNVVAPADVKWAKIGKAEVGFKDGDLSFIKSLEPRAENTTNNYSGYQKKERTHNAVSTVEILEDVSPKEIKAVYDELNSQDNKKCGASTPFQRANGKYDVFMYVTTFTPLVDELMGDGNPEI